MGVGEPDKRSDGAEPSTFPSSVGRRTGREAATWDDAELFVETDGHAPLEGDTAGESHASGNSSVTKARGRRLSSSSAEGVTTARDPIAESTQPRARRKLRQPPLSASCFLLGADGTPNDGLLSVYCSINYSKDKLHKFKFLNRKDSRDARKEEYKNELQAAQALIAMDNRKEKRSFGGPSEQAKPPQWRPEEALRATITVKQKKRQLARLAAEERIDVRDDLNNLLSELREGLLACYPHNEHLSLLSRRLDKISTQPELWAKYRPRLVHLHTRGFLKKWEAAGCPANPHKLVQLGWPEPPLLGGEKCCPEATAESTGTNSFADDANWKSDEHFSEPPYCEQEVHDYAEEEKETMVRGQKIAEEQAEGPSPEQLEELRQKQLEARARRERLRAAQQKQP